MANEEQVALLKLGVKAWNEWRKENPDVEINLSGATLLYADFTRANLTQANLSCAYVKGANLTQANLTQANLTQANFTRANLTQANLHYADFTEADLLQADLRGTILNDVYLIDANLSIANLSRADLRGANLFLSQAIDTNFSEADLTGACIADWHINSETDFEGVKCKYIYRGYQHPNFTNRLPVNPNKIFKSGEFEEWIRVSAEAQQTIDLTFTEGIDWQAFFNSLQGVRQKYPDANVGIQAIEEKGTVLVIRLKNSPDADQGVIESSQQELYETQLKLQETEARLEELRSAHQNTLETMVKTMAENQNVTQNFNAPVGSVAGTNEGEMKTIQHNYPGETRQTPAESAKEIQDLVLQLLQSNPTDIEALVEQRVKSDPTLRGRIRNALKEGGLETMKVIFPLTGIAIETVRGWVEAERD